MANTNITTHWRREGGKFSSFVPVQFYVLIPTMLEHGTDDVTNICHVKFILNMQDSISIARYNDS